MSHLLMDKTSTTQVYSVRREDVLTSPDAKQRQIIDALQKSSGSLQVEIEDLANRIDGLRLDSSQEMIHQFICTHSHTLQQIHDRLDSIIVPSPLSFQRADSRHDIAGNAIIKSLWFPHMRERYDGIQPAHESTYGWVLKTQEQAMKMKQDHSDILSDGSVAMLLELKAILAKSTGQGGLLDQVIDCIRNYRVPS